MTRSPILTGVGIEATWGCNLTCEMCPRSLFGAVDKAKHMSLDQFKTIIDKLPSTLSTVNFAGLGEIFVHSEWDEMFKYVADRGMTILLTTNGTLLDQVWPKLPHNTGISMHISIDTLDRDLYHQLRGYELGTLLQTLETFHKTRPDINLVIQALYMRPTMQTFHALIPLAQMLNAAIAPIYPICFKPADEQNYSPFLVDDFPQRMASFVQRCIAAQIRLYPRPIEPQPKPCLEPWSMPFISVKGEVYPCCYVYEARHEAKTPDTWDEWLYGQKVTVPQSSYVMGNIFEQSFDSIWQSESYSKLRENVSQYEQKKYDFKQLRGEPPTIPLPFDYCAICGWRHGVVC